MKFDQTRLRQLAPFVLPLVIVAAGWMLLIRPAASDSARAARELDMLRPRLDAARAALTQAPPPEVAVEPMAAFERQVTAGDPGRILEELSRLAPRSRYRNLNIDATGEQGVLRASRGPQASGGTEPDPRLALFGAELTFVPVSMSFESDYAAVGELLWNLRDFGTLVEVRTLDLKRVAAAEEGGRQPDPAELRGPARDDVRVTLTLFAYARTTDVAAVANDTVAR